MEPIFISGISAISSAGSNLSENWESLLAGKPKLINTFGLPAGVVTDQTENALADLRKDKRWSQADRAVLLGVLAARQAVASRRRDLGRWGVIFGSSRGATSTLETEHRRFIIENKVALTTSPATTPGVFASAVAQDLGCGGLSIFVSAACTTGLQAIGLGAMLIDAGMLAGAVVGGTEASVTGFTLAQLKAVKIYSKNIDAAFPCKPMAKDRCGTVIGDGSACLLLEKKPYPNALFAITGFGAATENGVSLTGVSPTGDTLVAAIKQALDSAGLAAQDIDFITGHGTGTVKGDKAEHCAYERVFGTTIPPRVFHKWMTGHLLGAAGAFSVALTTKHLEQAFIPGHPYFTELNHPLSVPVKLNNPKHALVSTLGFGGNAGALIISKIG